MRALFRTLRNFTCVRVCSGAEIWDCSSDDVSPVIGGYGVRWQQTMLGYLWTALPEVWAKIEIPLSNCSRWGMIERCG